MQADPALILIVLALSVSVAYNVFQAMRMRRQQAERIDQAELGQQLERSRRELRTVRADLAREEEKTDTLTKQLAESGRTRSTFLDNMGYYVRTPLNVIIGYSEMLLSGVYGALGDDQRERIAHIQRSGNDLLAYITDMLELHRLVSGAVTLSLKAVQVEPIIARVVEAASTAHSGPPVDLKFDVPAGISPLFADEQRIEQVLLQLVKNALRFTRQGSVMVAAQPVHVKNGAGDALELPTIGWLSDGAWIVITVSDTGIGIPSQDQASIFDTFYRVEREQTMDERGLGLGLAIAKRVIELHRGVIWVKSAEQKGSTFFVALRAYREARATEMHEQALTQSTEAGT
jgi:signal transduction histidine kinase